jgi:DNA-binding NtrC family response regulator
VWQSAYISGPQSRGYYITCVEYPHHCRAATMCNTDTNSVSGSGPTGSIRQKPGSEPGRWAGKAESAGLTNPIATKITNMTSSVLNRERSTPPEGAAAVRDPLQISPDLKGTIRILIVDDDRTLREGCASILQVDGYNVTVTGRGDEALDLVKRKKFDIVLIDLYMTPVPGMTILKATLQTHSDTTVVMMTGNPSVTSSLEALREGAWDYLPKPFSATHLQVLLGRAVHAVISARESERMRSQAGAQAGNSDKVTLLGVNPAFRRAVELARKVAGTTASVMITGESGTGKEVFAQFIHKHSRRAQRELVPINCAALPEPLLESEMFGHRKGSFTGADREKPGLLEAADGSTLFLDELTEMSQALQAKLLRVIQDGVVRRIGSEQQDAVVDVRFISATNRDPQEAVRQNVLRGDLYYRLTVVPIHLPPLRQRVEDIPILVSHFLSHYWQRHRNASDALPTLSEGALEFLQSRAWKGNVRELQNVIEHLSVLVEPGQMVEPEHIPLYDDQTSESQSVANVPMEMLDDAFHIAKEKLVARFEKEYLARLVSRASGNMSKAARLARIDRTTLYRLMEKHAFKRDESSGTFE